jgi:hypothetical protein
MSGAGEAILCGIVVEVLKTCFVYGKQWIHTYRHYDEHKAADADAMDEALNKLLDIRDFYTEFWDHIPPRDRRLLGKFLGQLHGLLKDKLTSNQPHDLNAPRDRRLLGKFLGQLHGLLKNESTPRRPPDLNADFTALEPEKIYARLGQYMATIEGPASNSAEDTIYVNGVWERTKMEIDKATEKMRYVFGGRGQTKKLFDLVGKWIDRIDELIAFRTNYILLRVTLDASIAEQVKLRVQKYNLPDTRNRVGMLLTNSDIPTSMTADTNLNPIVLEYPSEAVTLVQSAATIGRPLNAETPESEILGQVGSRHWATFSPEPLKTTRVIVEFKPLSQSNGGTTSIREVRTLIKALHIGARDADRFHVLDCLGLFKYGPNAIGILFSLPFAEDPSRVKCQTLNRILLKEHDDGLLSRRLGDRIALATSLAWSLSRFHMARWVHKCFSSDNVLLFQDPTSVGDRNDGFTWASPYLVGFELARPNEAYSVPLRAKPMQWRYKVYTHPDRLNNDTSTFIKFNKRHDIYSFGVVLLELGELCSFTTRQTQTDFGNLTPFDLRCCFRNKAQMLASVMGSVYAEVTRTCLDGNFGVTESDDDSEDTLLSEQFIIRVCERLESIHV